MTLDQYLSLKEKLLQAGYEGDIEWAETVGPPMGAETFFYEYAWVVINSGMKNQIATAIFEKVQRAILSGQPVYSVFRHKGKAGAIQIMWSAKGYYFDAYLKQPDDYKLAWLETLPWIGPITKFHLAKNLGMDVCKPDRHLVRIAGKYGKTPEELCSALAQVTGDRIGTVDYVIWRAANLGWI